MLQKTLLGFRFNHHSWPLAVSLKVKHDEELSIVVKSFWEVEDNSLKHMARPISFA